MIKGLLLLLVSLAVVGKFLSTDEPQIPFFYQGNLGATLHSQTGTDPLRFRAITATKDGFVLVAGQGNLGNLNAQVFSVGPNLSLKSTVTLGNGFVDKVLVGPDGNVTGLLKQHHHARTAFEWNGKDANVQTESKDGFTDVFRSSDGLISLSPAGMMVGSSSKPVATPEIKGESDVEMINDHVYVLDRCTAQLSIFSLQGDRVDEIVSAPTIQSALIAFAPLKTTKSKGMVVFGVAASSGSLPRLILAVSNFKGNDGLPIVELDAKGKLVKERRLALPKKPDGSVLLPNYLTVFGDNLYSMTSKGVLYRYPLS